MNQKDKVATPGQSEKLLDLIGYALETQWYWLYNDVERTSEPVLLPSSEVDSDLRVGNMFDCWLFPAPDVAELGYLLQQAMRKLNMSRFKEYHPGERIIGGIFSFDGKIIANNDNLAISFSDALIWLLEEKFIKPEGFKL